MIYSTYWTECRTLKSNRPYSSSSFLAFFSTLLGLIMMCDRGLFVSQFHSFIHSWKWVVCCNISVDAMDSCIINRCLGRIVAVAKNRLHTWIPSSSSVTSSSSSCSLSLVNWDQLVSTQVVTGCL